MLQGSFKFEEDGMDVCPRGVAADAVRNLMSAFHGLMFRDFPEALELRVDLRQTLPYRRVKTFLSTLEDTAQTLKLQMISRKYRCTFTRNYRALMPINRRLYRVDVLEAGQGCHGALWVNGERYVLGAEVVAENQHFRSCWYNLLDRLRDVQTNLDRSDNKKSSCSTCSILTTNLTNSNLNQSNLNDATEDTSMCQYCEVDWLTQLGSILIQFDKAWTNFERTYITELISIERRARHLVMECILTDEELQLYEDFHLRVSKLDLQSSRKNSSQKSKCSKSSPAFLENANHIRQLYIKFVNVTAALNAAANVKRKGRSDYKFDLFYSALMVVDEVRQRDKSCEEGGSSWICKLEDDWIPNLTDKELQSLLPIAQPLVTELSNFRVHLKVLGEAPERIDPHLAQNQTLVAHLAELEAKWDTAVQWLSSQETAQSLAKFLSFVTEIAEIDNALINRSNKRRRKSDAISTFKTSASKPDSIDSQRQDSPFESFEDRIAALDVAAFLALPRLVVLFFFCNPKADSKNYHLMSLLLPDIIRANKKNTKMMRNSASPNNRSSFLTHRELLNGAQVHLRIKHYFTPLFFHYSILSPLPFSHFVYFLLPLGSFLGSFKT